MRPGAAILSLIALAFPTAPALALDPCANSTAVLTGGFTMPYPGMGDATYHQEMHLEHAGAGFTGLWIGTWYEQKNTYPFALDANARAAVMAGTSAMPGVDALCVPDLPDANSLSVTCTGRFPFTFHPNGTITWEGMSQVLGEYSRSLIVIDMQRGTPGYAAQKQKRGEMGGVPTVAGDMSLLFTVTANGRIAGSAHAAYSYTITGRAEPAGADIVLNGSGPGTAGGPIVSTLARSDTIQVILRHEVQAQRAKQAEQVELTLTAEWDNGCTRTMKTSLFDAMLLTGTAP